MPNIFPKGALATPPAALASQPASNVAAESFFAALKTEDTYAHQQSAQTSLDKVMIREQLIRRDPSISWSALSPSSKSVVSQRAAEEPTQRSRDLEIAAAREQKRDEALKIQERRQAAKQRRKNNDSEAIKAARQITSWTSLRELNGEELRVQLLKQRAEHPQQKIPLSGSKNVRVRQLARLLGLPPETGGDVLDAHGEQENEENHQRPLKRARH